MDSIHQTESSLKIDINLHPVYGTAHIEIKFRSHKQNFKVDTLTLAFLLYLEQFGYQASIMKIMNESKYSFDELNRAITSLKN